MTTADLAAYQVVERPPVCLDYRGHEICGMGSRIIGYTAQSIINVLDFGLDPQESISVPHYLNRNGTTDLEAPIPGVTLDYDAEALKSQLEARGHPVSIRDLTSGLSMILARDDRLVGGADPRRDGTIGGRTGP